MRTMNTVLAASLIFFLTACTHQSMKTSQTNKNDIINNINNDDLYEVHAEGRLYVFDDKKTYDEFLSVGETSFRQTFIGSGPKGQTVVFGVTSEDKKKHFSQIASYNLYHGLLASADDFYGEMRLENRIYVFDSLDDMKSVREVGEASLRYTEIGSGPKGETVIYVLRNDNKKVKPIALIEAFKQRNKT